MTLISRVTGVLGLRAQRLLYLTECIGVQTFTLYLYFISVRTLLCLQKEKAWKKLLQ